MSDPLGWSPTVITRRQRLLTRLLGQVTCGEDDLWFAHEFSVPFGVPCPSCGAAI